MQESQQRALMALQRRGRLRTLIPRQGLDFSSNDYLGFAASDAVRDAASEALARGVAIGSGGSRLLRGNDPEHEALEAEASAFFSAGAALYVSSGFSANQSLLATLPSRGDLIVLDALAHASMWDGAFASKAPHVVAQHNDAGDFESLIKNWRENHAEGKVWIVAESVFSMDGDCAPLDDLHAIACRFGGVLVIDEAHATGVFGPEGRGLAHHLEGQDNVITLHTCGKALGAMGALVLMPKLYRDFLINRSRALIYATAPSPLMAAIVRASLQLSTSSDDARQALQSRITLVQKKLQELFEISGTATPIQPVVIGREDRAVAIAGAMQGQGFDVRAVRPPTVPEGTSRLRLSLTLNVSDDQTAAMLEALAKVMAEQKP